MTYGEFLYTKKCVVTDIRSYSEWNNVARTWPMDIESFGIIGRPHTFKNIYGSFRASAVKFDKYSIASPFSNPYWLLILPSNILS